ncbi:MAG: GNAT family N-acetyltransferase [Oscillospiraceae bacterium]|nr:GNAT family N-acetyltransferase [Oscillospiraceae bacterium]
MKIVMNDVVLRDYLPSDVEDEVRWTNIDTAWFYADTPWMTMEPVDPDELRADMMEIMSNMLEDAIRWRFEIEVDGRHIGMVSSYYLDENYEPTPWESIDQRRNAEENHSIRALGIEICEMDCWGKGIGTKTLTALMDYYRSLGEHRFLLETWSGNDRMLGCAKKLGFTEAKRTKAAYVVNGKEYDVLVLEKNV